MLKHYKYIIKTQTMDNEYYSVSYIVNKINNIFKGVNINIIGEITDVKQNNNMFCAIKDEDAIINLSIFDNKIIVKNGDKVQISGKLNFYKKNGRLQIIPNILKHIGIGDKKQEQERIKNKYEKKGYFNNRKPLPTNIKNIGVVTSKDGAVIKDIIYALETNYFNGNLFLYSCNVQGDNCPLSVSQGIEFFNEPFIIKKKEYIVDVILIARGGGSFEELSGFSDPLILEAIYNAKKYTISAVGHETDRMLCDEVSNYRCPTPSLAGTTIAGVNNINITKIHDYEIQLKEIKNNIIQKLYKYKNLIYKYKNELNQDPINELLQKLDNYLNKSKKIVFDRLNKLQEIKNKINTQLELNNINRVLMQGFAVFSNKDGKTIKTKSGKIYTDKIYITTDEGTFLVKKLIY